MMSILCVLIRLSRIAKSNLKISKFFFNIFFYTDLVLLFSAVLMDISDKTLKSVFLKKCLNRWFSLV